MNVHNAEFLRLHVASGWHQARTARELALDPSTVSRYLQDAAVPSLTVLRLFAGLIGERVLLPGEMEGASPLRDGPRWLEDWESDLVAVLRRVDPAARPRVVGALRDIVEALGASARYPRPRPADPLPSTERILDAAARDLSAGATAPPHGGSDDPDAAPAPPSGPASGSLPPSTSRTPRSVAPRREQTRLQRKRPSA